MTFPDKNSTTGNASSLEDADVDTLSASPQDLLLLNALRDFIIPLVRGTTDRMIDVEKETIIGPEAGKLIIALREFISGVTARSPPARHDSVEVNLIKEDGSRNGEAEHETSPHEGLSPMHTSPDVLDKDDMTGQLKFENKLLRALREHVFNRMPIRLLHFERHDSGLQISLFERGAIYGYLESMVQAKRNDPEFRPKFRAWGQENDISAIDRILTKHAGYAILSHTWLRTSPGEITYGDWKGGLFNTQSPGYQKLLNFCTVAWKDHGLALGWMDTLCINKESSSELDESIRSMYNWYERAKVCIVYLAETSTLSDVHLDAWFSRGWTLQELLAPKVLKFYNNDWKRFDEHSSNDKAHTPLIIDKISEATTITPDELYDVLDAPISRKMQLAAPRKVTREEDTAYSLMGIFNVSIATAYGEGSECAFFRLLREILNSTSDGILDIFNWAGELPEPRLHKTFGLPTTSQHYLDRSTISLRYVKPLEPLAFTHMGLRTPVLLVPGTSISSRNSPFKLIGKYSATVEISPLSTYSYVPTTYRLLDSRVSGPDAGANRKWHQYTFAVFNIGEKSNATRRTIYIPSTCIAIVLDCYEHAGHVTSTGRFYHIETTKPIVFTMEEMNTSSTEKDAENQMVALNSDLILPVDELTTHGMQLTNLYL